MDVITIICIAYAGWQYKVYLNVPGEWVFSLLCLTLLQLIKMHTVMYFRVAYAPKLLNATSQRLFSFRTGTTPPPI